MPDSKDGGKGPEIPRPMKPAVPPFRGPGTGGPSPLRPADPNSRLTRPPFIPPAIAGRKPLSTPAAPARPSSSVPVGAASIPEIAVPSVRAQELVEAIRPMSSSTSTPAQTAGFPSPTSPTTAVESEPGSFDSYGQDAALTPTPVDAAAVTLEEIGEAPSSARATSEEALPFVDPAPFVGTRPTSSHELVPPSRDATAPEAGFGFAAATAGERAASVSGQPSAAPESVSNEPSPASASHPLARTLNELAVQVDSGDLEVAGFEEGMSPEAALAATLAAMLKRAR